MSALSDHLDRLLQSLERPPSKDVRIVEIDPDAEWSGGRYYVRQENVYKPLDYENRFDELLRTGYAWLNMSCYGLWNGFLIVAIEMPRATALNMKPRSATSVNLSGPTVGVLARDWNVDAVLRID